MYLENDVAYLSHNIFPSQWFVKNPYLTKILNIGIFVPILQPLLIRKNVEYKKPFLQDLEELFQIYMFL